MLVRVESGGALTEQDRLVAGRYRLGEQAGAGAMGIVWRARDERLRRTVAVKQLLLQPGLGAAEAEEARQRAMREARIAARLQHPNAVIVYDVAEDDDQPWLIMEYVPSRSLAAVLRDGVLAPYQVAGIGAQIAGALAAAHAVGVVHRDVKPGNVLLVDDGTAKISDFGISRAVDDVVLTATGLVTGTPAYLAPEMAKGEDPTPSSDVFALGATLYAAVEGRPPFGMNDNPLAMLRAVAEGRVVPPAQAGPLTAVLMRLLRADPDERPTMREAQELLAAVASERTVASRQPVVDPSREWTRPEVRPVNRPVPAGGGVERVSTPRAVPAANLAGPVAPGRNGPGQHRSDRNQSNRPQPGRPAGQFPTNWSSAGPPSGRPLSAPTPTLLSGPPMPSTMGPVEPGRRGPLRLVLVVVLALVVVGTAVFVIDRAGSGTKAATTGGRTNTVEPGVTVVPDGDVTGPPTYVGMTNLVKRYYGMLPGDVGDAVLLLSGDYRLKHPTSSVRKFYSTIEQVTVGNFRQVGVNTVTAVLTFTTTDGTVTHEPYLFTVVLRHGDLLIDNAVANSGD
jgi:serine/threonine protein kinase